MKTTKRKVAAPVVKKDALAMTAIMGGALQGRRLILPVTADLRPSKNVVRQGVFNMLGSRMDWDGMVVADLCCGSGAWGLEALSRGAAKVYLVDVDVTAVTANVKLLGLEADPRVVVVQADVLRWVAPVALDVVLCDPPYGSTLVAEVMGRVGALGGSVWAVEHAADVPLEMPAGWRVVRREYGKSGVLVGVRN